LDDLIKSESWSRADIDAYQNTKLKELIRHAYTNVPYYREVMKENKLTPGDIKNREDLHKFPILTKEDARSNIEKLISVTANKKKLLKNRTSGTTGKALLLYSTREAETFRSAVWWRHRMRYNVNYGDWCVNFTGKIAVPACQKKPPFWRWNYPMRQVVINNQQINYDKIRYIIDFLNDNTFNHYVGYPSIVHSLAVTANEMQLYLLNHPRVIAFGAENITSIQLQCIKNFTSAELTQHYGSIEGCGSASYCKHGVYHEDFEYGILECVEAVNMNYGNNAGRVVGTGFSNFDFPLIRYETGDIGTWAPDSYLCACGLQANVIINIDGRMDDYILTPEGRLTKDMDYVFQNTISVKNAQIIQYKCDELIIRIVKRQNYTKKDEESIRSGIHTWISPYIDVYFEYVNEIEREPSGKLRFVKTYINNL